MPISHNNPPQSWVLIKSYARVLLDCFTGRRSFLSVMRKSYQRRYVRWHVRRHPGEPIRKKLPTGGVLLLDPGGSFIEVFSNGLASYEPDVQAVLKRLLGPGATFVDCGANVGFYSVTAQNLMRGQGKIIAIEANPRTIPLLNRNLAANGIGSAVNAAVTSRPGLMNFVSPRSHDALASLHANKLYEGLEKDSFEVSGRTLDDILGSVVEDRLDLIKIDIEGGELDAIKSGRQILARFRPYIIAEYSRITWPEFGSTPGDLLEFCRECHYATRVYDPISAEFREVSREFWESDYSNLVLIPLEKL